MEFQDVQLYLKNPDDPSSSNFGVGLDLFISSPIKITRSIQSIEEPTATTSSYSQTFRAPNTPTNSKFFKAVFNVNSVTFNAAKKVPAYINVNGAFFMEGNVILNNIIYSPDVEKIEYELVFLGEVSNFSSVVSPKNLSQLTLSELAHNLNYNNIQISWAGNLVNGNVVYPLAEYGYTYDDTTKQPNIPTLSVYNVTTGVKGFTNSANALNLSQFKPFVKAKYIWDKIFSEAGFTYTSNFLNNSGIFTKLYMISSNTSSSNSEMVAIPNLEADGGYFITYVWTTNQDVTMYFPYEIVDTANNWDPLYGVYKSVVPAGAGTYAYTFTIKNLVLYMSAPAVAGGPPSSYYRRFSLKAVYNVGVNVYTSTLTAYAYVVTSAAVNNVVATCYTSTAGTSTDFVFNLNLASDSEVRFYINLDQGEINAGASIMSSKLLATGPAVVDPSGLMPNQIKQIDFIKGINDRFKLMWEVDPENPKNFIIEPWVDWIKGGTQKDWTAKLDRNSDITITPLFQTQPRKIVFKDSEEADLYNFSYQQANKETFGQLNQDSGLEVITGEREIKSMFAPVPLGPIGNSDRFIIPHFAKDTETERQPIQIKPRLMFYNGTGPAPYTWYMKNDAGTAVAQTAYPIASQFSSYPFTSSVMDLNWTNVKQFWTANSANTGTGRTPISAYSTYWQKWFNFTYSPYGRVMDATFNLSINDLRSLMFNDKIFVKDSWWLPIEVKDYNLNQARQNVKVKLVKLGDDVGVTIGTPGTVLFPYTVRVASTGCLACCESDVFYQILTVYTNSATFGSSSIVFLNAEGTLPAGTGSYSNGLEALNVGQNGSVTTVTLCSGCTCFGTLNAFSVCSSTSTCGACCCSLFGQTIYGDGNTLATSTKLYGDNMGTTALIPYRWYRNASAVAQVGADGITIIAFGTCTGCYCGDVPPSE